jgi:hypothetical protein
VADIDNWGLRLHATLVAPTVLDTLPEPGIGIWVFGMLLNRGAGVCVRGQRDTQYVFRRKPEGEKRQSTEITIAAVQ